MYQYILTGVMLGISSLTDLKWRKVYKGTVAVYMILAILGHIAGSPGSLAEIISRVIPGIFFLTVSWISRQSLGYGDSLLLAVCGISLGLWPCIWVAFTAFFWAGIWALVLYRFRNENRRKEFPFVPFLFFGFVLQWIGGF